MIELIGGRGRCSLRHCPVNMARLLHGHYHCWQSSKQCPTDLFTDFGILFNFGFEKRLRTFLLFEARRGEGGGGEGSPNLHTRFSFDKRFIKKWGYRGQKFKKVEAYNVLAVRKFLSTRSKKNLNFNHSNRS